jgi:hypothetical protein
MTDPVTNVAACGMMTTPLWMQTVHPYLQFGCMVIGGVWIMVQIYFKIKNERRKK